MNNSPTLRRSVRKCEAVSSFSFPADHRTTSSRIKESRERLRIRMAVKKYRNEQKNEDKIVTRKGKLGKKALKERISMEEMISLEKRIRLEERINLEGRISLQEMISWEE